MLDLESRVSTLAIAIGLVLSIGPTAVAFGQSSYDLPEWMKRAREEQQNAGSPPTTAQTEAAKAEGAIPLLDGPIDPTTYRVGPGDVLSLTLQGSIQRTDPLEIGPEGSALVPGGGVVHVAGMTLADAREAIRAEVARAYRNVEIFIDLQQPRRFTIYVLGQVAMPGQYVANQIDRVSEGIQRAAGPLETASDRSVHLIRRDGTSQRCDLLRFWRVGDVSANPRLLDGDIIFVDFRREGVIINGQVHKGGQIEFIEGDSLGGIISLAGGLTQRAILDTVEVARFAPGSKIPQLSYLHARTPDEIETLMRYRLQPKDAVLVRADPNWDIRRRVEIRGEVIYPGIYIVDEDQTTLSDIVARAGGFTPDASLREATVVRRVDESIKDPEYERLRLVPPADMSRTEYEYFKMRGRQRVGLMAIDFVDLFTHGNRAQDVILKDGDLITVPLRKTYVTLSGQVALPGNIRFEPGLTVNDYIARAGGYAWKAAKGRTVVIRAATGEWVKKGDVSRIEAGDTIWVPEKPDREWFQMFKESLLILSQVATIYLVVKTSAK